MKPVVVHITRSTSLMGGAPRVIHSLISSLPEYDHKIVGVFPAPRKGVAPEICTIANVNVFYCPLPTSKEVSLPSYRLRKWVAKVLQWTFPMRLAKLLQVIRADLVHSHYSFRIDSQAIAILRKAKLPMIWTIHALPPDSGEEIRRWQFGIETIIHSNGKIVAVSEAIIKQMIELGICKFQDITVIYNGVDIKRFLNISSKKGFLRSNLKIPQDTVVFGTVGRLNFEKGHDIFVEAAVLLKQRVNNIFFVIVGSGPLAEELEFKIKRYNLKNCFYITGYQHDILPFLSDFDVFVMPSRREGLGLALIEALASGLPCIATKVGGIPEILGEDGGLMVPPESPEALAEAMYKMLSPELRRRYASRGPAIAKRFSLEVFAEQYARIYAELISKRH